MADLPHDIDPGIRPLVEELNASGFRTMGSCEGGEGHAFALPTVILRPHGCSAGDTAQKLQRHQHSRRRSGYSVERVYDHGNARSSRPSGAYVRLVVWSRDVLAEWMDPKSGGES